MSSYKMKFKRKSDSKIVELWCLDDYFGRHQYGYAVCEGNEVVYTEKQFNNLFENI